jgi:two-component system response regulator NreC
MLRQPIKVVIADDNSPFRNALKKLFKITSHVAVDILGEAENGQQLVELLEEIQPDIVISDVGMPVMNGIEATRIIKRKFPNIKVIAFSLFDDEKHIDGMIDAGASGYLLKSVSIEDFFSGITSVYGGSTYFKTSFSG